MVSVFDVNQEKLVNKLAEKFKADKNCTVPDWAYHVKTGSGRVRVPEESDWWYYRLASVFRLVSHNPQIGVSKLRTYYGNRKNRGHAPDRRVDAGGKIIRTCLQQLTNLDFLIKGKVKGRVLSSKGQSFIDNVAFEVYKEINKDSVVKKVVKKTEKVVKKSKVSKKDEIKKDKIKDSEDKDINDKDMKNKNVDKKSIK
jgi:small subunit ribosomal protein S19e